MSQPALNDVFRNLENKLEEAIKNAPKQIKNSEPIKDGSWTSKVVDKVKISDLASEFGVDCCPVCGYSISFDDSRGFFGCNKRKYDKTDCDFAGNIVNFVERFV